MKLASAGTKTANTRSQQAHTQSKLTLTAFISTQSAQAHTPSNTFTSSLNRKEPHKMTKTITRTDTRLGINPERTLGDKLQWAVNCLFDNKGNLLPDEYITQYLRAAPLLPIMRDAPEQYALLKEVMAFIMSKGYLPEAVRQYLLDGSNIKQKEFTSLVGVNMSTFKSQMNRSKKKIIKDFGLWALSDLTGNSESQAAQRYYLTQEELDFYRTRLNLLQNTIKSFSSQLTIDISAFKDRYAERMDEAEFNRILQDLWYKASRPSLSALKQDLEQSDFMGYVNYLLTKSDKTSAEARDYEKLMKFISTQSTHNK